MHKYLSILSVSALIAIISSCGPSEHYHTITGFAQGGTFHVIYSDLKADGSQIYEDESEVCQIINASLTEIDRSVSGYAPSSILSKVNSGEECLLDTIFVEMFHLSYKLWKETGGYFDVSGAPLFDFWGFGFKDPEKMKEMRAHSSTQETIDSILTFVGMDKVSIEDHRLIKKDPRIRLNFNAIAQGYSCDFVARRLETLGIDDYLVEVGMEILCKGVNARGKKWQIGIDKPVDGNMNAGENLQEILELTDCGVVTSGNYRKFFIEDGVKYSHSIDPLTGYPAMHTLLSATVIASDATTADAYATYCMVIGFEKAKEFITSRDDLSGYLIYDGGVWSDL